MTTPEIVVTRRPRAAWVTTRIGAAVRRHAFMLVLAFWWTATGVLYALQRNVWTRGLALVGAVGCVLAAMRMLAESRDDMTAGGAVRAFFAGAFSWTAVITLFFEGWVVGPPIEALGSATRGWAGAFTAIAATAYWEALALATIAGLTSALRGARNRVALWTFLLFWGAHQTAKLNLFFGVANSGAEIFPPYLMHLVRFFGPEHNTLLLPLTIVGYSFASVWILMSWPQETDGQRMRRLVLGALAGLAALEHGLLATRFPIVLWELFLRVGRA